MLEVIPTKEDIKQLLGDTKYQVWSELCDLIDSLYDVEHIWNKASREWKYEYKYRRGGKTLCTWYLNEARLGLLIIFGEKERAFFEADRDSYSSEITRVYDTSTTYHDGKWMLFEPDCSNNLEDFKKLLYIKRKPNRRST